RPALPPAARQRRLPDRARPRPLSCARKIGDGRGLALTRGHVARGGPPQAPLLSQPGVLISFLPNRLALRPGRLLLAPQRSHPGPAFPLPSLPASFQRADLPHHLLAQ